MKFIKEYTKALSFMALALILNLETLAQSTSLKVSENPTQKESSAVFQAESASKGILLPKVALTSTTVAAPVTAPADALTVYNTNTTGDVTPGYYYWSAAASRWIKILSLNDTRFWSLDGNTGTDPATNFIGTADQKDLVFKTGNVRSGLISGTNAKDFFGVFKPNTLGSTAFGFNALKNEALNDYYNSTASVAFGQSALGANTTGTNNTALGSGALYFNTTGTSNTAVGLGAIRSNVTGGYNTAVGFRAFFGGLGTNNTVMGTDAARVAFANNGSGLGDNNTLIGAYSGINLNGSNNNTALGYDALNAINYGNNNVAIGAYSGKALRNGANNVFLGTYADGTGGPVGTPNKAVAIGYNAKVGADNSMVLGGTGADALMVGIGMTIPTNTLHVKPAANQDPVRFEGLQLDAAPANLVTADVNGVLKTIPANTVSGGGWNLKGNAGTHGGTDPFIDPNDPATDFVGTTDAQDLVFKTNSLERLRLTQTSRLLFANTGGGGGNLFLSGGNETTTGSGNIGIGNLAIPQLTTGFENAAIGSGSGLSITEGAFNTIIGGSSGTRISTGSNNTIIGPASGTFLEGSGNILIGPFTEAVDGNADNQLNIGNTIFGSLGPNPSIPGKIGIGVNTPENTLHIRSAEDPLRLEGLQTGNVMQKVVLADENGVLKQLKGAMPKFFYLPALSIPTSAAQLSAPGAGYLPDDTFDDATRSGHINLYGHYAAQFGTTGTATQPSSPGAPPLPVLPAAELHYYVTWYDTNVFETVFVDGNGILEYLVKAGADTSKGSVMNIAFAVKD